jgi:biotin carboxyl carrier protein
MVDYEITFGDEVIQIAFDPEARKAKVGDKAFDIETTDYGNRVIVDVAGKSYAIELVQGRVFVNGEEQRFTIQKARPRALGARKAAAGQRGAQIKPPMPGRVVSVDVKVGDTVAKGQGVVVLEAMKMQNELVSPADGKVKAVHCKPGDNVDPGKVLVEID